MRKRSSRLQSSQHSDSIPLILGSYYEPQSPLEQRLIDPQPSQHVGASLYTRVPTSDLTKVSPPMLSTEQFQEYPSLSQTDNHQTRKRRISISTEISAKRLLKRARKTEKNLESFEMGRRRRKSAGKKSTGQSSSTTTATDKDFGTKMQQNNIIYITFDAKAADDSAKVKELLDQRRASEPPDKLAYDGYLVLTEDYENELSVEVSAYPLLSNRTAEREVLDYFQRPNHPWSAVNNHLTTGLSDAEPDIAESYRKTDYPLTAVEALSGDLAPSSYNEVMPAYTVKFKNSNGDMKEAKFQCAYNGALMTEGARAVHKYLGKSDDGFYCKTQALTVAFNGETIKFYGHHALQVPPSQPAGGVDSSTEIDICQYPQYLLAGDNPSDSFEDYQRAYGHTRDAEDIGFRFASERKDALWAYTNRV